MSAGSGFWFVKVGRVLRHYIISLLIGVGFEGDVSSDKSFGLWLLALLLVVWF